MGASQAPRFAECEPGETGDEKMKPPLHLADFCTVAYQKAVLPAFAARLALVLTSLLPCAAAFNEVAVESAAIELSQRVGEVPHGAWVVTLLCVIIAVLGCTAAYFIGYYTGLQKAVKMMELMYRSTQVNSQADGTPMPDVPVVVTGSERPEEVRVTSFGTCFHVKADCPAIAGRAVRNLRACRCCSQGEGNRRNE